MRRFLLALLLAIPFAAPLSAATVDGLSINSSSVGSGPTLVFVHGWTCDLSSWEQQVPAFSIKAPTLEVVAGTGQVPDVQKTREVLPSFEASQLAGTGHFLMLEKPAEFNPQLTAFLDQIKF